MFQNYFDVNIWDVHKMKIKESYESGDEFYIAEIKDKKYDSDKYHNAMIKKLAEYFTHNDCGTRLYIHHDDTCEIIVTWK